MYVTVSCAWAWARGPLVSDWDFIVLYIFCQTAPGDLFEGGPVPIFTVQLDLGAIFDLLVFQKDTFWTTFSHEDTTLAVTCSWLGRPCRDPAFP